MNDIQYFDFNHPNKILEKAKELELLLEKNGYPTFLNGGTLLGCVRENDLIKHDDDIDLFYISNKKHRKAVLNEFETHIQPILEKNGWSINPISWTWHKQSKLMMGQYHVVKDNISIDLWTGWFNKKNELSVTMGLENSPISKSDLFPPIIKNLRDFSFNIPNNSELHLSQLYGKDWRIPNPKYKISCNKNFLQKSILKVIDQFGWAYYFIAKEQQKYSYHKIDYKRIGDMNDKQIKSDIVYFHSPGLGNEQITNIINTKINRSNTKIIGAYGGEHPARYIDADLIVTISFPYLNELKKIYPNKSCIFLPEAMDTEFFKSNRRPRKSFNVGYVGRPCKVKRMHLLNELKYDVKTHTEWGKEYFYDGRTLNNVKNFYKSIDCLVLTSQSECMPRVILEAMSMGLPVISTDVGCVRMLIESEWIVPNSSEEDIVKNINDRLDILKKYPQIRKNVGKRNRKYIVNNFNWEKIQQLWDDVFNALSINDYDTINKIGLELENKWNPFYKNYIQENRKDLKKINRSLTTNNINFYKLNSVLKNVVMLKKSCLDIIKNHQVNFNKLYVGINSNEIQQFKKNLVQIGYMPINDYFKKDDIKIYPEIYNDNSKTYGCNGIIYNVPFPVIQYLEKEYGVSWNK